MRNSKLIIDYHSALTGDGAVFELEQRFAELLDNRPLCLSVINATSGLAALLCGLPRGRVIAPLFTSPATYAAIHHAGHEAVFCDIDSQSLCLPPEAVKSKLGQDVRAIVTVNIFGHMSHLSELRELADRFGAMLILDAAQSLGTCLKNPQQTCLADAAVFSLGPAKWLGCPDGGMVAVMGEELWEQLVRKTQHTYRQVLDVPAQAPDYEHFNYRINPHSAALALAGLQHITSEINQVHQKQQRLLVELNRCGLFEAQPGASEVIFEPLTALPLEPDGHAVTLYDLPIPALLQAAQLDDLPETWRQLRYRKVIGQVSSLSGISISEGG